MNPPAAPPTAGAPDPLSSPLHQPSVVHNTRILSSLGTLASCFSGLIAGIIGLTNSSGFLLYLITSLLTALILGLVKCGLDVDRYVAQAHMVTASASRSRSRGNRNQIGDAGRARGRAGWRGWWALTGIGQETFLGFLLFWIGSYALIHVYD